MNFFESVCISYASPCEFFAFQISDDALFVC